MAHLAIKSHATRGSEVIELLKMLRGENLYKYKGENINGYYYIGDNLIIDWCHECTPNSDFVSYTIEEFLEKFPYKIGDKVLIQPYVGARQICEMRWDSDDNYIKYGIGVGEWINVSQVQPYKEETMEEKADTSMAPILQSEDYSDRKFGYKIPKGYEFDCIKENEIIIKPIKPQYPKTYEECCKVLSLGEDGRLYTKGYKANLIQNFQKLCICRDAYWKIAGEQMGLGKPWEPDYKNPDIDLYVIINIYNQFKKARYGYGFQHCLFAFPTEEMRDAFFENFKDLIEDCKELL